MKIKPTSHFATEIQLPCRVMHGTPGEPPVRATTIRLDSHVVVISVSSEFCAWSPAVVDRLTLEIQLPGEAAKCLKIRGQVMDSLETVGGARRVWIFFRRPAFGNAGAGLHQENRSRGTSSDKRLVM